MLATAGLHPCASMSSSSAHIAPLGSPPITTPHFCLSFRQSLVGSAGFGSSSDYYFSVNIGNVGVNTNKPFLVENPYKVCWPCVLAMCVEHVC